MIVAFTSTAFNNFVAQYVQKSGDSTFNPYLQFLFFALYVLASSVPSQSLIFLQSWSIGGSLHWILLVSHLPTIRILTANLNVEKNLNYL